MNTNMKAKNEKPIMVGENPQLMEIVYLYMREQAKRTKDILEPIFKWVTVKGMCINEKEFNEQYNETGKGRSIVCWLTPNDILKLADVEVFKTWARTKLPKEYSIVENIDYYTLRQYMFKLYYRQQRKVDEILNKEEVESISYHEGNKKYVVVTKQNALI
jgi:hypothetical protein